LRFMTRPSGLHIGHILGAAGLLALPLEVFSWPSVTPVMVAAALAALACGGWRWSLLPRWLAALCLLLLLYGAAGVLGYMLPMNCLLFRIRRRRHDIEKGLANALDLMVVCVESGLGLDQTIPQVAKELQFAYPDLCDEFEVMNLEMRAGKRPVDALHNLAERTGVEDVRKLADVLIQTDRFGASIAQSLRGHADYLRVMAHQKAEEWAGKLAGKLVFPIFFCVLPSLFVVTVGPVLTHLIRDLLPSIGNV